MIKQTGAMQALQLQGINRLVRTEVPIPTPKSNEVLIRTVASTICTSDLFDIASNPFQIKYPRILGHEGSGVVVRYGSGVQHFEEGDRVAVHPVVPCGSCYECQRGFGHICSNMGHLGHDRDGTFAEYVVQRADRVRKLSENVPIDLGALMEPVAVCLQAIARAGELRKRTVLIVGDGPFGNIIARLARRAGAERVLVSGKENFRLQMIRGAEIADENLTKYVDVAILAVSSSDAVATCLKALRPRGRLVVFSSLEKPFPLDLFKVHVSELEIVGACNDEDKMEESLECLGEEALALDEIITHQYKFDDWEEAFSMARYGHDQALKVAIRFNGENFSK